MTTVEFWQVLNIELVIQLAGLGLSSFALGYGVGYKLYLLRRFMSSAN